MNDLILTVHHHTSHRLHKHAPTMSAHGRAPPPPQHVVSLSVGVHAYVSPGTRSTHPLTPVDTISPSPLPITQMMLRPRRRPLLRGTHHFLAARSRLRSHDLLRRIAQEPFESRPQYPKHRRFPRICQELFRLPPQYAKPRRRRLNR